MKTSNAILFYGLLGIVVILIILSITFRMNVIKTVPLEILDHVCLVHVHPSHSWNKSEDGAAYHRHAPSAIIVPLSSETSGATKMISLPAFQALTVSGKFNVVFKQGSASTIVIPNDPTITPYIHVLIKGEVLEVNMDNEDKHSFDKPVAIMVEADKKIQSINLGGLNTLQAVNIDTDHLSLNLGGSIPQCELTGSVGDFSILAGGSFNVQANTLSARDVHILMAGSGSVFVNAKEKLSITGLGAGIVYYAGNPSKIEEHALGKVTIVKSST